MLRVNKKQHNNAVADKDLLFLLSTVSMINWLGTEAAVRKCSTKKGFLKTSQNSQENTRLGASF